MISHKLRECRVLLGAQAPPMMKVGAHSFKFRQVKTIVPMERRASGHLIHQEARLGRLWLTVWLTGRRPPGHSLRGMNAPLTANLVMSKRTRGARPDCWCLSIARGPTECDRKLFRQLFLSPSQRQRAALFPLGLSPSVCLAGWGGDVCCWRQQQQLQPALATSLAPQQQQQQQHGHDDDYEEEA